MRSMIVAFALAAFAMGAMVHPATAAKSKMGCEIGKEVWDAKEGKCVPGAPKAKSSSKSTKKKS